MVEPADALHDSELEERSDPLTRSVMSSVLKPSTKDSATALTGALPPYGWRGRTAMASASRTRVVRMWPASCQPTIGG